VLFRSERTKYFDPAWTVTGKTADRERNIITSLNLDPAKHEKHNQRLQAKYRQMEEVEVRYEKIDCDDAEFIIVAYGSSARICQKAIRLARNKGIKAGLFRPVTLFPFPSKELHALADQVKGMLSVELNAGQMIEDVKLAVNGKVIVQHFGRYGGMIHTPDEILEALEQKIINP
jgi:2-oxoglutarate/2-oxoacid ferredoxin oxidoreductase subunit alpha